jgi:glycosyltransferase involved in cell wall biosynthesis
VAQFAYGAMSGSPGHVGGVERQTTLMARWLAARGHAVTLIVWDEGQEDDLVIDGVRVITMCARDAGVRGMRFLHPRWTSLVGALARADADVYYQNCGEYTTGQVALWCRMRRRRFVYSVASDPDCDPALPLMHTWRERRLYRYGLLAADAVVVQTQQQRRMLHDGFGRPSAVIPMPCPDTAPHPLPPATSTDRRFGHVLWIGRICRVKRPDRLLDAAAQSPHLSFHLVGPLEEGEYAQGIARQAAAIPNITVHGPASRDDVPRLYQEAACVCCTSDVEGFPNTFLEAWSHGVPVVSTLDPDGLIASRRLGFAVAPDGLTVALSHAATYSDEWIAMSHRARRYYEERHTVPAVMSRFERLFLETARRSAPSPAASR